MLHVRLDLAPVEPWLEVWTKIVPGTRYNCILEKIENWSLWSWKTLQTVRVALGCEAPAVPPHNLPFLLPFLPSNWVTSLRRTSSLLIEKRLECSALSITCWPLMVGCPSQPLTPCKLLLPFLKTHRRVKLKVSIRAATGSMAVACLFSAEGLGGGGHRVICWLPSLTPLSDVRRTAAACLLRAVTFSSGLKLLFCVTQFRLCLRRGARLPSFLLQSARLLPHYFFHIITSHSAEISLWGPRRSGSRKCFLFVWFTLLKMCLDTFMERAVIQTDLTRFASNSGHLPQVFFFFFLFN